MALLWKSTLIGTKMEKAAKIANLYVATLRSIYLTEQFCHWTTKGPDFYGNHLLFQRLYEGVAENADAAAEKMIGVFGKDALDCKTQCELINKVCAKYSSLADKPLEQALAIEKDFIKLSEDLFNEFEKMNAMTLGLDDLIMSIANKREEAVYLLQQALNDLPKHEE